MAGVGQRLEIRQGQSLVMTPQLQQAIKLLQLSNLELAEYVEAELEKNPLLERDESESRNTDEREADVSSSQDEPLDAALAREDFSETEDLDADRSDAYAEDPATPTGPRDAQLSDWTTLRSGAVADGGEDGFDRTLSPAVSLKDHLAAQLAMAPLDAAQRLIAATLIDAIDETGYLRATAAELAAQLGADEAAVEKVLSIVQGFDPTGVGARDLAECLSLQLREQGRLDGIMQVFLQHLDLVARRDIGALCSLCGTDSEDIGDMIAEIRSLTPKPGL